MTPAGRGAAIAAPPQFSSAVSAPWTTAAGIANETTVRPLSGEPPASACAAAEAAAAKRAHARRGAGTCAAGGRRAARLARATVKTVTVFVNEKASVTAPSSPSKTPWGGVGAWRAAAAIQGSVTTEDDHGSSVPMPSTKKHAEVSRGLRKRRRATS